MKLNELINEFNSGEDVSNIAINVIAHLVYVLDFWAYCPCCNNNEECKDDCDWESYNPTHYAQIKLARRILKREYNENINEL